MTTKTDLIIDLAREYHLDPSYMAYLNEGNANSGNWNHAGRPGEKGGSLPKGAGGSGGGNIKNSTFKKAFDKLSLKHGGSANINEMRSEIGAPKEVFDKKIKELRDSGKIQLEGWDKLMISPEMAANPFIDENGDEHNMFFVHRGQNFDDPPGATDDFGPQDNSPTPKMDKQPVSEKAVLSAYDRVKKGHDRASYAFISDLRKEVTGDKSEFDKTIEKLRDTREIQLLSWDRQMLPAGGDKDPFVDINGDKWYALHKR